MYIINIPAPGRGHLLSRLFQSIFANKVFFSLVGLACALTAYSQTVRIENTGLEITLPVGKWEGGEKIDMSDVPGFEEISRKIDMIIYTRKQSVKTYTSTWEQPAETMFSIQIEKKPSFKSSGRLAAESNRNTGVTVLKTYTGKEQNSVVPKLPDVTVQKIIKEQPFFAGSIKAYIVSIIDKGRSVGISLSANAEEFDKLESEFVAIIRSITSVAPADDSKVVPVQAKRTVNICDYFPLRKKMVYTYEVKSNPNAKIDSLLKLLGGGNAKTTFKEEYSYDSNKTIDGKIFKGYSIKSEDETKNGRMVYYNCSGNDLKINTEIYEWMDEHTGNMYRGTTYLYPVYTSTLTPTGRYMTIAAIKGSIEIGDIWTETEYINNKLTEITTSIEDVDLSIVVNDETYHDVIKVVKTFNQSAGMFGQNRFFQEVYYAKGIGMIKTVNTASNALSAIINSQELVSYLIE